MALTQTWTLQDTSTGTEILDTSFVAFDDGTFGNPITVAAFNGGTHVRDAAGNDDSTGRTTKNSKYVAAGTVSIGVGTVNIQSGTITSANAPLLINISYDSAITLSAVSFYAYDGTTPATGPVAIVVYAAEVDVDGFAGNDATWTELDGSGSALALDEATFLASATSHDAFLLISASPESVGVKNTDKFRITFTYQ